MVNMFADETTLVSDGDIQHPLFYISDSFTAAAFVSQASNRRSGQASEDRPATAYQAQGPRDAGIGADIPR